MDDIPIAEPPPGVTANFENPESRAWSVYITIGICILLVLVFTTLRFYARFCITKRRSWSDIIFALGVVISLTYFSLIVAMAATGIFGVHQWDILLSQNVTQQIFLDLIVQALYGPAVWLIKVSLFVLLLEIFGTLKWLRYLAIGGAVITGLFYFSILIAITVLCAPHSGTSQLDYLIAQLSPGCIFTRTLNIVQGAINIGSDIYLFVLPLPAVWSLHMTMKKKLAMSTIFATGLVACISSMLGLKYRIDMYASEDETWTAVPVVITSIVEMTAGIIVSCMPATTAAFRRWKVPILETFTRSSQPYSKQTSARTTEPSWAGHEPEWQPATFLKAHSESSNSSSYGQDEESSAVVEPNISQSYQAPSRVHASDNLQQSSAWIYNTSIYRDDCTCDHANARGVKSNRAGWFD